jgi:FkbM family methyltransferase
MNLTPKSTLWKALEFYGTRVHHRGKWRLHEQLRKALKIDHSEDLEVSRQGLKWILNPGDYVQSSFYWTGEFETWDEYHLFRLLPRNSIVFDVGANFGYYALTLAHAAGARVFAFEPSPRTFTRLRTHIAINGLESSITAVAAGLSDTQRSGFLDSVAGNSGADFLSDHGDEIELDTLDHYCEVHNISRMDFIKIDVEGHEAHVLRGAQRMLEACRPAVMIEFNVAALRRSNSSPEELEALLRSSGYELFRPVRKKLVPLHEAPGAYQVINVFALHRTP